MRKQELIHTHALLLDVRKYVQSTTDYPVPTPQYEALDIKPTSIHKGKTPHKQAAMTLLDELTSGLDTPAEDEDPISAPTEGV